MVTDPNELFLKSKFNIMLNYTEAQLKPISENYLKKSDKVFATEDGNFFLPADEAEGRRHAEKYKLKWFEYTGKPENKDQADKRMIGQILQESEVILKANADGDKELNTINKEDSKTKK